MELRCQLRTATPMQVVELLNGIRREIDEMDERWNLAEAKHEEIIGKLQSERIAGKDKKIR
jgi:hypothetical protein